MKWTTPINRLIREDFVLEDEDATSHTTIEDALSHRTGLPRHDLITGQANDTPSRVVQRMRYLPMTAQPRTQWQYCNNMYAVVTDLIQTVTGMDLEIFLQKLIWGPLGMASTTFHIPTGKHERPRLARGYYWNSHDDDQSGVTHSGEYIPEVYINLLDTKGDGATISTVNDYALWIKALLDATADAESRNSSSPITGRIYRDLVTARAIIPEDDLEGTNGPLLYALGWVIAYVGNAQLVAHNGGLNGFGTEVYLLPKQDYGVVTMGNTADTSNEAGSIIVSKLLLQKLNSATDSSISASSFQQGLLKNQQAGRRTRRTRLGSQGSSSMPERFPVRKEHLPLPLPLSFFAGLYSHPAYGTIDLAVPTSKMTASSTLSSGHVLETTFDRKWVEIEVLTHISGTLFEVKNFEPHGLGNISTGEGIVWEEMGDEDWEAFAIFEFGIDGRTVDRVGIELEPEMIGMARTKGKRYWRDGMIWFERVG